MPRTDLDLAAFEERLLARRAEIEQKLTGLTKPPETRDIGFGKRIGDGTIEAVSRLTEIGVGRSLETTHERVTRALQKLEEGTYGVCDTCGAPIPVKRLEFAPESVQCVSCAAAAPR